MWRHIVLPSSWRRQCEHGAAQLDGHYRREQRRCTGRFVATTWLSRETSRGHCRAVPRPRVAPEGVSQTHAQVSAETGVGLWHLHHRRGECSAAVHKGNLTTDESNVKITCPWDKWNDVWTMLVFCFYLVRQVDTLTNFERCCVRWQPLSIKSHRICVNLKVRWIASWCCSLAKFQCRGRVHVAGR